MSSLSQEIRNKVRLERVSGSRAFGVLRLSGLLDDAQSTEMPHSAFDLELLLNSGTAFALIGYVNDDPVGYVIAETYWPGRFQRHLFLHQCWSKAHPAINAEAAQWLEDYAKAHGCDAIATTVPPSHVPLMKRRYKFTAVGIHMTKTVSGHGH